VDVGVSSLWHFLAAVVCFEIGAGVALIAVALCSRLREWLSREFDRLR